METEQLAPECWLDKWWNEFFCEENLKELLEQNAKKHFEEAISHIKDDFLGSHWLASFALLALDAKKW